MQIWSWWREDGFRVRQRLPWAPAPRVRRPRAIDRDLQRLSESAQARARELCARHAAAASWSRWLDPVELQEALYQLDVLTAILADDEGDGVARARAALDVGSTNAVHLPALFALCPCPWTLVEIDAHRRYWNLVTRRSRGEQIARAHAGCRYLVGSVRALAPAAQRFDLITWTLPFIFEAPLAARGLPDRFFEPGPLLDHVLSLLSPRGALVIINQGESERDEQRRLLAAAGVAAPRIRAFGPLASPLSPFRRPRWAFRVAGR